MVKCKKCSGWKAAPNKKCTMITHQVKCGSGVHDIANVEADEEEDDLAKLVKDAENKKKKCQDMKREVSDTMNVRLHSDVFPRDHEGFSQEAYDYCESVIRIIQRHMEGNTNDEALNVLSKRRLPPVWVKKRAREE